MAINLTKGSRISLTKESGVKLTKIAMGLGWDAAKPSGGFLGRIFGAGDSGSIDLDASCICFDENQRVVDTVWFRQLKSRDGAIVHSGDNRTGDGDGDDETITVDLSRLDPRIKSLVFTVNSFTGQNFNQVENASCRVYDATTGEVFAEYNLSQKGSHTGLIMLKVYLHNGEWKVHALGETLNGRVVRELEDQARQHL